MPGGSVNGRPFKESKDSFQKTGIPCGNPKRYQSQDVVRMSGQSSVRMKDLSGPVEDIETEGQRQLKSMLEKQLNTTATIRETLAQSRQFSQSTLYKPATDDVRGIVDLSHYRTIEKHDSQINELRLCGLTDEEIRIKMKADGEDLDRKKPRLEYEPSYLQAKLKEINEKIACHKKELSKPDTFSGQTKVGRHAMDLERSLVKDNIDSKRLSSILIKNETSSEFPHPDHPMNHIPEILEEVAGSKLFEKKRHRKRNKEKKKHFDEIDYIEEETNSSTKSTEIIGCKTREEILQESYEELPNTSSTSKEKDIELNSSGTSNISSDYSNSNLTMTNSTIVSSLKNQNVEGRHLNQNDKTTMTPDRKIIDSLVHQIPEQDIIHNRLSVEEIRKLPKFQNYEPGTPNNVLFLKNLPQKVTENELGSLFLRYQSVNTTPITFRIMSGRMRGQAFVTFHDKETAEKALTLINGYKLHDKPIIIQYGKQ